MPDSLNPETKEKSAKQMFDAEKVEAEKPNLSLVHRKLIEDSAISPEVVSARGYFTATRKAELKKLGFKDYQQSVPALIIPIRNVTGDIVNYQSRPDRPRIKDGKTLKYETVAGSKIALDIPPDTRALLGDPNRPLFITEGARKADSAVSNSLCCIALLGVWNWRGTNDDGGTTALADWESIALKNRKVYIVFDSDVVEKEAVEKALARLKGFLELRGAYVKIVYLPSGAGGTKIGLDDYFAQGHTVDDLLAHATDKLRVTVDLQPVKLLEKVISKILPDGRIIEQIAGCRFVVFDPKKKSLTYTQTVETDDAIYYPLDDEFILKGGLFLPNNITEYVDDATLDNEINECINRYSDVPERERKLAGKYVKLSYLQERLNEIPYLHAVGRRGSGKSRFICVIGMLCMKPILVISPSAASLYRMMDAYHPTLIIDECNLATDSEDTRALIQILNSGFQRLTYISRCEKGSDGQLTVRLFSPFGPKLIGGLKLSESEAFESRCLQIRLEATSRKDIKFRMTDQMLKDFADLRAKLYTWRLKNLDKNWEKEFDGAEQELKSRKIEPRFIQISTPAYALITDAGLREDFASMMETRTDEAAKEKKESFDGRLVSLIHAQLFDVVDEKDADGKLVKDANDEPVTKLVWKNQQERGKVVDDGKPCESLVVELLVEKINEKTPEKHRVDVRYLAKQIRELGFKTREVLNRESACRRKLAVVFDGETCKKIFGSFSLAVPADFLTDQPTSNDKPLGFQQDKPGRRDLESTNEKIFADQDQPLENQQDTASGRLVGEIFPDKSASDHTKLFSDRLEPLSKLKLKEWPDTPFNAILRSDSDQQVTVRGIKRKIDSQWFVSLDGIEGEFPAGQIYVTAKFQSDNPGIAERLFNDDLILSAIAE